MDQAPGKIRLLLIQALGWLSLAVWTCAQIGNESPSQVSTDLIKFKYAADSVLYPLGMCLLAYVLFAMAAHLIKIRIRYRWVRAAAGILGLLPVLIYALGALGQWCIPVLYQTFGDLFFRLAILRNGFSHPGFLLGVCVSMLLLVLAVETGPSKGQDT